MPPSSEYPAEKSDEKTGLAVLMLLACGLFWGSNVVVGRAVHEDLPPIGLAFWRNVAAFAVMLPFTARGLIEQWPAIRANMGVFLAAGVIGTALFNAVLYWAVQGTTAVNASLMMSLCPVTVPIFALLILRVGLTWRQAAGIAASLGGVVAIVTRGDVMALADFSFNQGDLLMIGAMACWSFYTVIVKLRPPSIDPFTFLSALLLVAVVTLIPFYAWESATARAYPATWEAAAAATYLGLFPTALALLFFNKAVEIMGPNRTGPYNHLVPVFATILAVIFLDESLALFHLAGAAFIAVGLYLATAPGPARRA